MACCLYPSTLYTHRVCLLWPYHYQRYETPLNTRALAVCLSVIPAIVHSTCVDYLHIYFWSYYLCTLLLSWTAFSLLMILYFLVWLFVANKESKEMEIFQISLYMLTMPTLWLLCCGQVLLLKVELLYLFNWYLALNKNFLLKQFLTNKCHPCHTNHDPQIAPYLWNVCVASKLVGHGKIATRSLCKQIFRGGGVEWNCYGHLDWVQ